MSVKRYSAEFQKLSRYAPTLVPDEETKAERFRDGLTPRILERIIYLQVTNYTDMVHTATMAEKGIRIAAADFVSRKRSASTGALPPPPFKRQSGSSSAGSQGRTSTYSSQGSGSRPRCSKCGKLHSGECRSGSNACYRCGKSGCFARECTQVDAYKGHGSQAIINQPKPVASARVYSLTPDSMHAGENTTDVVTGTIPLFGSIACVLFDSGATHSFISASYVKLSRPRCHQ